jgi:hypothetical protein
MRTARKRRCDVAPLVQDLERVPPEAAARKPDAGWGDSERVTPEPEPKLVADVGLVGTPNARKSTLLRASTGVQARSTIAFSTLNPVVGVFRVAEDGSVFGGEEGGVVYGQTVVEKRRENEPMESYALSDLPTHNRARGGGSDDHRLQLEAFRFTIADNPRTYIGRIGQGRARTLVPAVHGTLARARLRRRSFWPARLGAVSVCCGKSWKRIKLG